MLKTSLEAGVRTVTMNLPEKRNAMTDAMFEQLMEVCKYASLGEITNALFEVGGQYRRNM